MKKEIPLLIKCQPAARSSASFSFGSVRLEKLFESIPAGDADGNGFAATGATEWHSATANAPDDWTPWDVCHAMVQQGAAFAGSPAQFIEPDTEQQWLAAPEQRALTMALDQCGKPAPQDSGLPHDPHDRYWFRDEDHSQLEIARDAVGRPGRGARARIAHLDSGFDPDHATVPERLDRRRSRSFLPGEDSAEDQSGGLFNNLGHGTGTLAVLAGNVIDGEPLGGAPDADIVTLRVANSVVLFRNSAIARAMDYVHKLTVDGTAPIDVMTMSMGGVASRAWADAVNALYDAGVFCVTAAGNNFGNLPTRHLVYPARFRRVVAACGVMHDGRPWTDLELSRMAGNYGPKKLMDTAMAAFTPNAPWARIGCSNLIDYDGGGTSLATPQIAAAAALWIQKHREALNKYPEPWMRVEAARMALFDSAKRGDRKIDKRLGRGALRAANALQIAPAAAKSLKKQRADRVSFPILRILTGLRMSAQPDKAQEMLELEALQICQRSAAAAAAYDAIEESDAVSMDHNRALARALYDAPGASWFLKKALDGQLGRSAHPPPSVEKKAEKAEKSEPEEQADEGDAPSREPPTDAKATEDFDFEPALRQNVPMPAERRLRVFAFDPGLGTELSTLHLNEATIRVPWEPLRPGPVGEYVEVIDIDPASGCVYAPVDLEDPALLTQDGLAPAEGVPRFHQQMVYAVAMKTIRHFELALGRRALWQPRLVQNPDPAAKKRFTEQFIRRLRIYPHGVRDANAYYSPNKAALLFGYFSASRTNPGANLPGGVIFTTLSHDIIAHETTHALLDGIHKRYREPTNLDVLAFHEAFSDIVALFQHFTLPEALRDQIARTRGDLRRQNLLGELAQQFGEAIGHYGALRSAIGESGPDGWRQRPPRSTDYQDAQESHARGAVLVAAVFDAFHQIYRRNAEPLIKLATGGSGILPEGYLSDGLVEQLSKVAAKTAGQVLTICIRAIDYCPPVDITFGEYLRALITADQDLVPDDKKDYRVAFISAFRRRGIFPEHVASLSSASVAWQKPTVGLNASKWIVEKNQHLFRGWDLQSDRHKAWENSNEAAGRFWGWLMKVASPAQLREFGLDKEEIGVTRTINGRELTLSPIEVHSVRPCRRIGPDGNELSDFVAVVTQAWRSKTGRAVYRGGCTLIIDANSGELRYAIRKRVGHEGRIMRQAAFLEEFGARGLRGNYYDPEDRDSPVRSEPFCMMHRDI